MTSPTPPIATRIPVTTEQIGRTRTDHYNWLKDDNWQQVMRDPTSLREDIKSYLVAENAYTKANLEAPHTDLCKTLVSEMRGRIQEDASSVAAIDGPYAYYSRYRTGEEYPVFARRAAESAFDNDADETILFDGAREGSGKAYFDIGAVSHSPDHRLLAYSIDEQGSEYGTLRVRDIETGNDLGIKIETSTGDIVWTASSDAFYWVHKNENGRSEAVYRHILATGKDTLVYREADEGFFVSISESQSGEIIFITANDHTTSEFHWISAHETQSTKLNCIAKREAGHEYSVVHHDGAFFIQTNKDSAVDFKIMRADLDTATPDDWTNIVPHSAGTLLIDMLALKDHLVWLARTDGLPTITIRNRSDGATRKIDFEEAAYSLGISGGYMFDTTVFRFSYASPSTPDQVFDYDIATDKRDLRKTRLVPSGHTPSDYIVERRMAPADDGTQIPITLLRHKDTPIDGTAPLLLYGYGSYGITIPAGFSTSRLSLVDRGMIYAIAHVRGSTAKGYQWYLDGKLDKKVNTFKDYITAGRFLVEQSYTSSGRIVGMGGSAGGLLMGAASNLAPDLFAGIIAAVPFVDVLNTMSDETLPLTPPEWPEWGNPKIDTDAYDRILSWSPYDQVSAREYPPMMITGGLSDPRVTYWEPAKWAAKLRHEAPNAGPYYLRINMDAGHGGATGRFEGLSETALEYAFALSVTGIVD
ncbi:MAG: S9 family peptidase [Hyphomonadaceae bacterium]